MADRQCLKAGLDIGSTTIKMAVVDGNSRMAHHQYERHYGLVHQKAAELLKSLQEKYHGYDIAIAISGSAGMGLAEHLGIPFVQEVHATRIATALFHENIDAVIELGGEDAKIIFGDKHPDARMNGTCAGGTGAFIDQMASLLHLSPDALNEAAKGKRRIYTIASRCGVFAKSDIQPLLNQGAQKADIAASIFQAVVNQTVAGLAQGREIKGNVLYLGGPLTFFSELRAAFDETLGIKGLCPDNSLFYVALGAASCAEELIDIPTAIQRLSQASGASEYHALPPLFQNAEEYNAFRDRHAAAKAPKKEYSRNHNQVFLGVDAGSTTIKFAVVNQFGELIDSRYEPNDGNPVWKVKGYLKDLHRRYPDIDILECCATGYGEALIKNAFRFGHGIVETMAHFIAARRFDPNVDYILDIGGQDIKCMKIRGGVIDNIDLNEACSSGCGSFLQTFAAALGYSVEDFSKAGLYAKKPVDLGSRCTVFMNSSVKQAQKDGASIEDISAGLSISVIKNAIYKVIRPGSLHDLGRHIVVQGGTFYNDAVLRVLELELGAYVTRPDIAGLMGAYGAALFAYEQYGAQKEFLWPLSIAEINEFSCEVSTTRCGKCANACNLTINTFSNGRNYISGNRCEQNSDEQTADDKQNLYAVKRQMIRGKGAPKGYGEKVGIPVGLNMYELLPFWTAFFHQLHIDVVLSPMSNRELYLSGQSSIPGDTVCYPAKLMHGHVRALASQGVKNIFYPCMSYHMEDKQSDNCFNCPVVAYYPEVINANMAELDSVNFIYSFVGLHKKRHLAGRLWRLLHPAFGHITQARVKTAVNVAYATYAKYKRNIHREAKKIVRHARQQKKPLILLAGRPYHIDPEISHGIDHLALQLGACVISEDAVRVHKQNDISLGVFNQWSFHNRLYDAAHYAATHDDVYFVQLVSFGCGCDAITTDECRTILESKGKMYTQIKIDEIENLGAARIRLRSMLAAAAEKKGVLPSEESEEKKRKNRFYKGDEAQPYYPNP